MLFGTVALFLGRSLRGQQARTLGRACSAASSYGDGSAFAKSSHNSSASRVTARPGRVERVRSRKPRLPSPPDGAAALPAGPVAQWIEQRFMKSPFSKSSVV